MLNDKKKKKKSFLGKGKLLEIYLKYKVFNFLIMSIRYIRKKKIKEKRKRKC